MRDIREIKITVRDAEVLNELALYVASHGGARWKEELGFNEVDSLAPTA